MMNDLRQSGFTMRIARAHLILSSVFFFIFPWIASGAPVNDNFSGRIVLSDSVSITTSGTNVGATKESGEPNHSNNAGGRSVWWSWTAPSAGTYTIKTVGSSFDTTLGVYTGTSVNGLSDITHDDDSGGNGTSLLVISATAGQAYQIAVDGYNGNSGSITFSIDYPVPPPANDNFANPTVLTSGATYVEGVNSGATNEIGEPLQGGRSVWYQWTAPSSGEVTVQILSSSFYSTLLGVYTGVSVNALTQVGASALWNPTTFRAISGTVYRIAVDGSYGASGSFTLTVSNPVPAPANDAFANPIAVASGATTTATNSGASKESGEPFHGGDSGGHSVWFEWTAPSSGEVTVQPVSSEFNTLVGVYTGVSVDALTPLGGAMYGGPVMFRAISGTVYRIAVDGYGGTLGSFTLTVSYPAPPPANDAFASAIALGSGATTTTGTNAGASKESGEPDHYGEPGGHSVWYTWTAPSSGEVTVRALSSSYSTLVGIYSGVTLNALTPLGGGSSYSDPPTFRAFGGTIYRIAVDCSASSIAGSFTLTISAPIPSPANDSFANRLVLAGAPQFTTGTNEGATKEAGEPDHNSNVGGRSVWYSWTAPTTAAYNIAVAQQGRLYPLLGVYTGAAVNDLTVVGSSEGWPTAAYMLNATMGTTYQIAVDGGFNTRDSFRMSISQPPANDAFASALNLGTATSGTSASWIDPSVGYETGEPNAPAFPWLPSIRSIWWTWTASANGLVEFDTLGSGYDTIMEVFTGTAVNALTLVAQNVDASAVGENRLAFTAVAGTTYRVRLRDDESHHIGAVSLHFTTLGTPVTATDHVRLGRAYLQQQTDAGMANADAEFAAALSVDANHPEACFLKAITTFAMLEQGAAFQNALSGLGILDSNIYTRRYKFPTDGMGKPIAIPGTNTSAGIDYLGTTVLPALTTIRNLLSKATAPSFATSLSDTESSGSYYEIDAGDVGVIKTATLGLEAVIRLLQTFDAGMSVADAITDYNAKQLDAEKAVNAFANLLNSTGNNQRTAFKNAVQNAITEYNTASAFIRSSRTGDPTKHLYPLADTDFDAEQKILDTSLQASQALDGPVMIGGETTDLSKFISSSKTIREQLPVLVGNKGVASTTPDPTFDGVMPYSSQAKVNDFLRKKGLLHDVSSFGNWAAAFLKNQSSSNQAKGADPDKDMLNNFAEYAFNLRPDVFDQPQSYQVSQMATSIADGKQYLTFAFVRRVVRPDLSYVVAVSDNLSTWDRTQVQVQQAGVPQPNADGQTEVVTYRLLARPEVISRKFMRLEVTDLAP